MAGNTESRTVVLVGATSGIGRAAAQRLAADGHTLILVGRNEKRGESLLRELGRTPAGAASSFLAADVATAAGVDRVAQYVIERTDRVDVLVNNAGIVAPERTETEEGMELNFAVHHLAPFSMTARLLPLLQAGQGRVVNVNSDNHRKPVRGGPGPVKLDFSDLHAEHSYDPFLAYSRGKLANLLFTYELHRRHPELTVLAFHPGLVRTDLPRSFPRIQAFLVTALAMSPRRGAEPLVRLAMSPEVRSGGYYDRFDLAESSPESHDPEAAARLWEISEKLRGAFP